MTKLARRNHRRRNRERRYRKGVVYAKDFGVRGNGTADDTDAMQLAFDKARREVRLRPDVMIRITRTLIVRASKLDLRAPWSSAIFLDQPSET
jgi:hypothetical protein